MTESLSTIQPTTSSHETESGVSAPVGLPESETVVVEDATPDSGKKLHGKTELSLTSLRSRK